VGRKGTLIPLEGEIVIEIDEANSLHKLKIGDGIHTYAELAYLQAGDEIVTQVLAQAKPRIVTVTLAETWNQDADGKYSQVVEIDNITEHSRLDLQPDADMIAEFKQLGIVFVTENNSGIISVYSVGNMPAKSYAIQATIVETECSGKNTIVGIPVGASAAQSDWNQEDETKADYVKNKPMLGSMAAKDVVEKSDLADDVKVSLEKADVALNISDIDVSTKLVSGTITEYPQKSGYVVTVTSGDTTHTFESMPVGLYAVPKQLSITMGNDITLSPNTIYNLTSGSSDGHIKLSFSTENRYDGSQALLHFHDQYRIVINTDPSRYILHIPSNVVVPEGWIGAESTLYDGYRQYTLKKNIVHDITIDHLYGPVEYILRCNVDYSGPFIVTGNFPTSWLSQPEGATSEISTMNLSHTTEEMIAAFQSGRDVLIRLTNNDGMYEFGNWKLRLAELIVTDAQILSAGYYQFYAYGTGYAQGSQGKVETTPMQITCSLNPMPRISTPIKP
jgi:hypothetical protein